MGGNSLGRTGLYTYDAYGMPQEIKIPGLSLNLTPIAPIIRGLDYFCVSAKKDGKNLQTITYQMPKGDYSPENFPGMVGRKLATGSLNGEDVAIRFVGSYGQRGERLPVYSCGNIGDPLELQAGDSVTYRIQYPVGTVIRAGRPSPLSPDRDTVIQSNFASSPAGAGSGFLLLPNVVDVCVYPTSNCTSTITATTLSGEKIDLLPVRERYWQWYRDTYNGEASEYFSIPADTATLELSFHKK